MLQVDNFSEMTILLHNVCNSIVSKNLHHDFVYQALICGKKITNSEIKMTLNSAGLIHIMVVSGAHLVFIEHFINKINLKHKFSFILTMLVLTLYATVSGFMPPVTRALIYLSILKFNHAHKLFWPRELCILLSALTCIALNPTWALSLSLHLSWVSACIISNVSFSKTNIHRNTFLYLFLLPLLYNLGAPGPFSILINILFLPLFGSILFPLTWISGFIAPLRLFTDFVWENIFLILKLISPYNPQLIPEILFTHRAQSLAYALCIQTICLIFLYKRKNNEVHQSHSNSTVMQTHL